MPRKPSIIVDLPAALWVLFVGVIFYGGYFWPDTVGMFTGQACVIYLAVLLIAVALAVVSGLAGPKSKAPE